MRRYWGFCEIATFFKTNCEHFFCEMCALFNFFLSNVYTFTDVPQKKFTKTLVITAPSPLRYQSEMLYQLDWRDAEMGYKGITVLAKITQILYIYIYNGQSTSIHINVYFVHWEQQNVTSSITYFCLGGGGGNLVETLFLYSWDSTVFFYNSIHLNGHPCQVPTMHGPSCLTSVILRELRFPTW